MSTCIPIGSSVFGLISTASPSESVLNGNTELTHSSQRADGRPRVRQSSCNSCNRLSFRNFITVIQLTRITFRKRMLEESRLSETLQVAVRSPTMELMSNSLQWKQCAGLRMTHKGTSITVWEAAVVPVPTRSPLTDNSTFVEHGWTLVREVFLELALPSLLTSQSASTAFLDFVLRID